MVEVAVAVTMAVVMMMCKFLSWEALAEQLREMTMEQRSLSGPGLAAAPVVKGDCVVG